MAAAATPVCRRCISMVEWEPDILLEPARVRHGRDERDEALAVAGEALEIADRCEYWVKQADCHNFLAGVAMEQGDTPGARRHAETARERAECDGPPHRYEAAYQEAERLLAIVTQKPTGKKSTRKGGVTRRPPRGADATCLCRFARETRIADPRARLREDGLEQ